MRCVFVTILVCLVAPAHPNDSMDKLGDKLAATLTNSVDHLGDKLAHSMDKLGDTLVERVSDRLADRAFKMQSPYSDKLDNTVHAKPGAANAMPSPARHTGFPVPSLKTPFLHAQVGGQVFDRHVQHGPKATVGRVNLRDLYNPVHTPAEAKALAGKGLGYHVRPLAPFTDVQPHLSPEGAAVDVRSAKQEDQLEHVFQFNPEAPEFHPGAFGYPSETAPQLPFKFSHTAESAPEAFKPAERFFKSSAERAWAFTHPKGFQSPPTMSPFHTESAILHDADMGPTMIPARAPPLDIDSVIDRDISSRRTAPGRRSRSVFSQ
jgi:hypothetical protein